MEDAEAIARVGLAGWFGGWEQGLEPVPVLGVIGDDLCLIEIDPANRARALSELIDGCDAGHDGLRVEIVFFGDAGGVFASPLTFLEFWPEGSTDMPTEVFVDEHHKAAFTRAGDEVVVSVRHARRLGAGPPRRRFRFPANGYEEAMSCLAAESRRLRDDLIALARERAPRALEPLGNAFKRWPA